MKLIKSFIFSIIALSLLLVPLSVNAETVDKWTTIEATIPESKAFSTVVQLNDKAYIIGGSSGDTSFNQVKILDLKNFTWSNGKEMPVARSAASAVVYDGKIYVVGGYTGNAYTWGKGVSLSSLQVYDPELDTWTAKASMPQALGSTSAIVLDNKIYVFGGLTTNIRSVSSVQVYDPLTDSWSNKKDMQVASHSQTSVTYNGKIYLIGGRHIDNATNVSINSFLEYDPNADSWITKNNLSIVRAAPNAVVYSNKIMVIGGNTGQGVGATESGTVESFDFEKNKWNNEASLNIARTSSGVFLYKGQIYVVGGTKSTVSNVPINSIEVYGNPTKDPIPDPVPEPTGDRAILTVTLVTGITKEYDLSSDEVNNFINWYDNKDAGIGPSKYGIDKHDNNKGPFNKRIEYLIFGNILTFEVNEYSTKN
ncbi:Kelch repeat-containing protein [Paenibacillus sp. NPDC056722]|uniref:Kelch repeat-containing protein n=1 Tax=Paenibacillus sp. NPDC056722 TaxID=3345924 RepID=UPI003677895C